MPTWLAWGRVGVAEPPRTSTRVEPLAVAAVALMLAAVAAFGEPGGPCRTVGASHIEAEVQLA